MTKTKLIRKLVLPVLFLVLVFSATLFFIDIKHTVTKADATEIVAGTDFTLSGSDADLNASLASGYFLVGQAGASSNSFGSFVSAASMSRKKGTIIKFATPIDTTKVKTLFFAVSKNIGANTVFDFYKNQSGITVGTSDPVASFTSTGSSFSSYSDRNTLFFITLYTSDLADAEGYIDSFIIIHESDERVDPNGNDDYAAFGTRIYSISANVIKANSEFKFTSSGIVASVADGYTAVGQAGTSVNSTLGEFVSSGMRRQYYSLIKFERPFDVRVFESISFYLGKNISANVTYDFYKNDSSITIGDTSQSGQTVVFSSTSNSGGADSASTVNTLTVNLLPFADSDGLVSGIIMAHTTDTRAEGDYSNFSQRVYNITANSRSNLYYKVSFNADNGSAVNYGFYGPTVTEPSDPVKADKVFKWWYLNDENTAYDFSTVLTSDITLTAKWVESYTVSFAGDGIDIADVNVEKGSTVSEPDTPVRTGYVFDYWYSDDINEPFDFSLAINEDVTLTAKWTALNKYSVSVNTPANGTAVLDVNEQYETYQVNLTLTPNNYYHLASLEMNGTDVTAGVVNGVYTFTMPSGNVSLVVEYEKPDEYSLAIGSEFIITNTNKAGLTLPVAAGPVTEGSTGLTKYYVNNIAEETGGTVVKFANSVNIGLYNTAIIEYKFGMPAGQRVLKFYKNASDTDLSTAPAGYFTSEKKTSETNMFMTVDLRSLADGNGDVDSFIISLLKVKNQAENLNFYSVTLTNETYEEKSLGGNVDFYLRNNIYDLSANLVGCFDLNEGLPSGVTYISTKAGMTRGKGTAVMFSKSVSLSDYKAITFDISKNTSDTVVFSIYPLNAASLSPESAVRKFTVGKSTNTTTNLIISLSDIGVDGICGGFIIVHESDNRVVNGVDQDYPSFSIRVYPIELKKERTVTFNGEGAEGISPQTVNYGASAEEPAATPEKASTAEFDYVFDGWYNGEIKWNFDNPVTENITLESRFNSIKRSYTVTFNGEGADGISPQTVEYGALAEEPAAAPEKTAVDYIYSFDGWYNGEVKWNFDEDVVTSDIELYSRFTQVGKKEYTATFIADGNVVDTVIFYFDTVSISEPAVPIKQGYNGMWETYSLNTENIEINAVYTAKYSLKMGLDIKEDITARFTLITEGYTDIVFKINDTVITAAEDGKYYYGNICPQTLCETLTIDISATNSSSEEEILYENKEISVVDYLIGLLDKSAAQLGYTEVQTAKMKQLAVDLMYYAQAAQTYTNTNTDKDIVGLIDGEYSARTYVSPVSVRDIVNNTGDYTWYSATLTYKNTIRLVFTVSSENSAPDFIRLNVGGNIVDISENEDKGVVDGRHLYRYYYDVSLVNFGTTITAKIVVDNSEQSAVLTYSVASYVVNQVAKEDIGSSEKDFLKRVYCYGKSAYEFAESL